ncbi:MAG: tRNA (adenosine(37)-N6)-threonylcarbamoyltransferase complex dimerization subunit type 1 TsaB [Chitinophagaceae bacterium]|nr:tRNA (adenosine(37)-N6)-threonylcarbamoyltransferase complex dimerization subunit type 1 TsaB [Chitinophagaceae bacterium]
MNLILNIDTTAETALVNIADDGIILFEEINPLQKDHAAFLQPAIQTVMAKAGIVFNDLAAVAVCHGPGSYTGIRVGLSSAKGLCYVLNKPLIILDALTILAKDVINSHNTTTFIKPVLYCSMIDARRMEVFTAIYDKNLNIITAASAIILNESTYVNMLLNNHVIFFGSGAAKWQQMCTSENASFVTIENKGLAMSSLSYIQLQQNNFAHIVNAAPLYLKEFFDVVKNA